MGIKYKTVIFDFDGTVVDSAPGILKSAENVIRQVGIELPNEFELRKFIGPPIRLSFVHLLGVDEEKATEMVELYREDYEKSNGILNAEVYGGMEMLLQQLNDRGAVCAVASAKRETIVRETARKFGISKYFKCISGAPQEGRVVSKAEILQGCIDRIGVEKETVLMVGDSFYDAEGAQEVGVDFCAAMWGYGFDSMDDLKTYKCRYVAPDVESLARFLLV